MVVPELSRTMAYTTRKTTHKAFFLSRISHFLSRISHFYVVFTFRKFFSSPTKLHLECPLQASVHNSSYMFQNKTTTIKPPAKSDLIGLARSLS